MTGVVGDVEPGRLLVAACPSVPAGLVRGRRSRRTKPPSKFASLLTAVVSGDRDQAVAVAVAAAGRCRRSSRAGSVIVVEVAGRRRGRRSVERRSTPPAPRAPNVQRTSGRLVGQTVGRGLVDGQVATSSAAVDRGRSTIQRRRCCSAACSRCVNVVAGDAARGDRGGSCVDVSKLPAGGLRADGCRRRRRSPRGAAAAVTTVASRPRCLRITRSSSRRARSRRCCWLDR